ncbi:MAG: hypothetical protein KDA24_25035, partial [Deltaproteobacteria bacterium]|nr:hypothetical protein [Deltaproteobacteria bacterium]
LSVLAANAMALVRLDAMTVVPLMGVLGVLLLGVGRGALLGAACFVTTMLHMAAAWRISGDPIGFARVASMNTQRNADGFDFLGPSVLPVNVAGEVGWTVLLLALPGAVWLWRACATKNPDAPGSRPAALALLGAWAWMFVVDFGLTTLGAMEARTMRYLVPLLVLVVAVGAVGAIRWGEALAGPRWVRWMLPAGFAITLLAQGPAILRQATQERLPAGLTEAAGWLGSRGDDRPVVVGEQHPVFVVVGGLDWARTGVLPPGAPGENRGPVVADVVGRAGAGWLVQGEGDPPEPAIESGAPGATERHRAGCCVVWELP